MRLAFLIPIFGDAFGQEKVLRDVVPQLQARGVEILILAEHLRPPYSSRIRVEKVLPFMGFHWLSSPSLRSRSQNASMRALDEFKPDLVHLFDLFDSRSMARIARKYPTVLSAHSVAPTCPASDRRTASGTCTAVSGFRCVLKHRRNGCLAYLDGDLRRLHAVAEFKLRHRVARSFSNVLAVSDYVSETLIAEGFSPARVTRIYNPVVVDRELRSSIDAEPGHVVSASRLVPLKGVDHLIRALARCSTDHWALSIAGEGGQESELRSLADRLGIAARVRFLGRLSYEQTQRLMCRASVVAQANLGAEAFGLTLGEASALGRPVVCYRVKGIDEVVDHDETGMLAERANIDELASYLDRILGDPLEQRRLGDRGAVVMSRRFSLGAHVDRLMELYKGIVGERTAQTAAESQPCSTPIVQ